MHQGLDRVWDTSVVSIYSWVYIERERLFWAHSHQIPWPVALGELWGLTWCLPRRFGAQSSHFMGQIQEMFGFLNPFVITENFSLYLK